MQKLVVIGGGAAGFFCAVNAARLHPHLEVMIVEKSNKVLSKVRVSGGGRCNVTHSCFSIAEMIQKYPRGERFLKQAFHHFFTKDTVAWFQQRGIPLKTEADGRIFPESNSSETIIDCLVREAKAYCVQVVFNREVQRIEKIGEDPSDKGFQLSFKDGTFLKSDYVCIACGGYPKEGQYQWLAALGHTFEKPFPSLFTFNVPNDGIVALMGISLENVLIKITGTKFSQSGPLLITHWGFSGPATLKLSAFAARFLGEHHYDCRITINWLPAYNENTMIEKLKVLRSVLAPKRINSSNPFNLPQRLWEYHLQLSAVGPETRWADLPAKQQNFLARQLCSQSFHVAGKTTFKEEFVTAGGIRLREVHPSTMESKIVPGLYFAGEILDVDGITGGFNFQHAWTSGYLAAKSAGTFAAT